MNISQSQLIFTKVQLLYLFSDWVFENDEFAVMKVTSYEIVEGIELVMYTAEDGDLDDLPDYLPDNYDGQG